MSESMSEMEQAVIDKRAKVLDDLAEDVRYLYERIEENLFGSGLGLTEKLAIVQICGKLLAAEMTQSPVKTFIQVVEESGG